MRIGGMIDRLDAVSASGNPSFGNLAEHIRVIDYKTGRAATSHPSELDDIFGCGSDSLKRHSDYYLQSMLYSIIVSHNQKFNPAKNPVSPCLLFIQNAGAENYTPILKIGKAPIEDVSEYEEDFWKQLENVVNEIYNPNIPFSPTTDHDRCKACPYAALCH